MAEGGILGDLCFGTDIGDTVAMGHAMHVLLLALVLLMGGVTGFSVLSFGGRRTGMRLTAESSQGARVSFGQGLKGRGRRRFVEEVCVGVGGWMVGVGGAGAEVSAGTSLPDGAAQVRSEVALR